MYLPAANIGGAKPLPIVSRVELWTRSRYFLCVRRFKIDPDLISLAVSGAALAFLSVAERRAPLRKSVDDDKWRVPRSMVIGAMSLVVVRLLERPVVDPLAEKVEREKLGPIQQLPKAFRIPAALLALDYTLFAWHWLAHRTPLWRFHRVHHADLDLDTTTAMRFHAGEMALSTLWRMAQVRLLGIGPKELYAWRLVSLPLILYHHANIRFPEKVERFLSTFLMTPTLHGIHHSAKPDERESNWASGLVIWDRLHRTYRTTPSQEDLVVGDPEERRPLRLWELLSLPEKAPSRMQARIGD
jgi:sterol desaturase/sphingolipid hydroxylase (fatty acid hydroxylase superfamily)